MRVAITHPYSWPDVRRGAERIVVETASALAARGHQVTVFTSGREPGRRREGAVLTVRLRRLFDDPHRHERSFGMRLVPYLVRNRFDAVHAMMPYDAVAAIVTRPVHGHRVVYDEMGNPYRWFWDQRADGPARRRVLRDVDVYGCMSQHSLDVLQAEWGRTGSLIPGGVRLSEFAPAGSRAPEPTLLFSGALDEPRKGLAELLAAAALVADDEPQLRVWLSGQGDPSRVVAAAPGAVRDRVEHLPLGNAKEQGARYARAWATVLPSRADSFGLVLIESLASGTPIAVIDDGAPPSLVTPATGAVAPTQEPEDLAKAIRQALDLSRQPATADRCREFAARFDWDAAIAPLLEDLYRGTA